VGVVPRQFLRELVDVFDLVEHEESFDPAEHYRFEPKELTLEEEAMIRRRVAAAAGPDDGEDALTPVLEGW